ncbi:MAG: nitroreductase family protein [Hyphomicrobiales bacterium]
MTKLNDLKDALSLLKTRRSVIANNMSGPGPSAEQIDELLEIAARVPDHGKLSPWRFILFREGARKAFGRVLAARQQLLNPQLGAELIAFEARRFERADTVIGVVSCARRHEKIPEWEQQLSAGAVCQNLLIAATAMGYAAQWLTEWYSFDTEVAKELGLEEHERMAGFIYLSSTDVELAERPRPDVASLTTHWTG